MPVVDVHTHMLPLDYLELLKQYGGEKYTVKKTPAGELTIYMYDAPPCAAIILMSG